MGGSRRGGSDAAADGGRGGQADAGDDDSWVSHGFSSLGIDDALLLIRLVEEDGSLASAG
jgi:hypothetical protein